MFTTPSCMTTRRSDMESDEKTLMLLQMALHLLNKNPDQEFDRFVRQMIRRALITGAGEERPLGPGERERVAFALADTLENRIRRWADRKDGVSYFIVRSYLDLAQNIAEPVRIDELEKQFETYQPNPRGRFSDITLFRRNFRMLCTSSAHAPGRLFEVNRIDRTARLAPEFVELITSLKDQFQAPLN